MTKELDPRIVIAKRCALEMKDGDIVNLGIGIPTLAADYLAPGVHVLMHSENGCIGMGPKSSTQAADSDCTNARRSCQCNNRIIPARKFTPHFLCKSIDNCT